jgi:hypothetical protein
MVLFLGSEKKKGELMPWIGKTGKAEPGRSGKLR